MKTELTKEIEKSIFKSVKADGLGIYGGFEIAIGSGYGNEYVDFMTMDSKNIFRCYEIKISSSDLKSRNKLSFYGDFNYYVLTKELYEKEKEELQYGIGIYIYNGKTCELIRKSSNRNITIGERINLMSNMVRSLSGLTTKLIKGMVV